MLCRDLESTTRPVQRVYNKGAIKRGSPEEVSSWGMSTNNSLSLKPLKKAAVTSIQEHDFEFLS